MKTWVRVVERLGLGRPTGPVAIIGFVAAVSIAASAVHIPLFDSQIHPGYRALYSSDSNDVLALGVETSAQLNEAYGLFQALGVHAPGADIELRAQNAGSNAWVMHRLLTFGRAASAVVAEPIAYRVTDEDMLALYTVAESQNEHVDPWALVIDIPHDSHAQPALDLVFLRWQRPESHTGEDAWQVVIVEKDLIPFVAEEAH